MTATTKPSRWARLGISRICHYSSGRQQFIAACQSLGDVCLAEHSYMSALDCLEENTCRYANIDNISLHIARFFELVRPESQLRIINKYQNYFAKDLRMIIRISSALIDNNEFATAVELLNKALISHKQQPHPLPADLGCCLNNMGAALSKQSS